MNKSHINKFHKPITTFFQLYDDITIDLIRTYQMKLQSNVVLTIALIKENIASILHWYL